MLFGVVEKMSQEQIGESEVENKDPALMEFKALIDQRLRTRSRILWSRLSIVETAKWITCLGPYSRGNKLKQASSFLNVPISSLRQFVWAKNTDGSPKKDVKALLLYLGLKDTWV